MVTATKEEIGATRPMALLRASLARQIVGTSPGCHAVERVVLVHRLREVVAQVGFTRFEAITPDVEGELEIGVQPAPLLARSPGCRPSRIEARGSSSNSNRCDRGLEGTLARS